MRFPLVIKYRRSVVRVFGRSPSRDSYRVVYFSHGRRRFRSFKDFSEAKEEAERIVRALVAASPSATFTGKELADVLASKSALQDLRAVTGKPVGLAEVVSRYCDAVKVLPEGVTLNEAVRSFVRTVHSVKRVPVRTAIDEFNAERELRTVSKDGRRPQLSPRHWYQDKVRLGHVAKFWKGDACDLNSEVLRVFFDRVLGEVAPATRNHVRGSLRIFLRWCEGRGYRPEDDKLRLAPVLVNEKAMGGDILIHSPAELRRLLDAAEGELQLLVAIAGLAGLRSAELLRLSWDDLFRRPGFIEVTAQKAKTRARRLVPVVPSLERWLQPWRGHHGDAPIWTFEPNEFFVRMRELFRAAKVKRKANGLRHGFITYRLAQTQNENQVSQEAGTSPQMVFGHYRELADAKEAAQWFGIAPEGAGEPANVVALPTAAQS